MTIGRYYVTLYEDRTSVEKNDADVENLNMKLCLIYTPFCWPTGIPLGIAYLKSYLKTHNPLVTVKNLDLNINFFDSDLKRLSNLCEKCPKRFYTNCIPLDLFLKGDDLQKAKTFFKNGTNNFSKKESYVRNYDFYRAFFDQIQNCYKYLLQPFLEDKNKRDEAFIKKLLQSDLDAILAERPDIIGFSANINQIHYSLTLAKIIKEKISIPIIFGGYFASSFDTREIMQVFPFIDFIVYKEGEKSLSDLLRNFSKGEFKDVSNLAYRKNGRVIINQEAWIDDLDKIPFPDFSDFHINKYFSPYPVFPILYSRGCYWKKCAFCAHYQNYSGRYRIRSTDNTIEEIEFQKQKYGVRYFLFCDEQISAIKLGELNEKISGKKLKIYYGLSGFRPSQDVSRDILRKAYNSGCRWIYFGVESLTQRLLDLMRKGTEVNHILRILRWCGKLGITPFISYIWGFPTQAAEEVKEEARLCEKYKDFFIIPDVGGLFGLERGSDVYMHPERYKIEIRELQPRALFKTSAGKITSIHHDYNVKKGLSPAGAKRLFYKSVNKDIKYEKGAFWEHLLILSAGKVRLVFSRQYLARLSNNLYYNFMMSSKRFLHKDNAVNRVKIHFHLGICYERLGKYNQAIKEFLKAQRLNGNGQQKNDGIVNFHLGICYEQTKKHNKALEAYRRASNLSRDIVDKSAVYSGLSRTYYYLKRYKETVENANKVLKLDYKKYDMQLLLGFCYEKIGRYKKAINELKKVEKIFPEEPQINFSLSNCFRKISQIECSNKELEKGILKSKC